MNNMQIKRGEKRIKKYLILDGVSPEDHLEIKVKVHPNCNTPVL